eukprot:Gb_35034 [translate_table: standard]
MENKERNIVYAREDIEAIGDKGAKLVVLPEIWNGPYSNESFLIYEKYTDASGNESPSSSMLSKVSHSRGITIVGGSIPERSGDHLYNTCCSISYDLRAKVYYEEAYGAK